LSLAVIATLFAILLALGYRLYGGWVAGRLGLDDSRRTPAHEVIDRVDFLPTRPFYLFGQHFSAIAAAGPIAGPILACQTFGWLPCMLWVALGVILIGAVHDFSTLFASVRHGARSIAQIAGDHLGVRAGRSLMLFIWIALIYVMVAFADITAASFTAGPVELEGRATSFHPGGAVAVSSVLYLVLALILGLVQKAFRPPLWLVTLIFVPATFGTSWLGVTWSQGLLFERTTWGILILAYCAIASLTPVWALLQPRGYLGGFVLYTALALGCLGVFFGGYEIRQPAFRTWDAGGMTGSLFPFLFVTIACGACSGFHGLVCSGTTSKQIDRESHTRPVGYGAMLAEGFVALIALVTVMIVTQDEIRGLAPGTIYGNGIGRFLTLLIGEEHLPFAMTFGAMAFSTFVFDTLDVSTRLGRYIVQELTRWKGRTGAAGAAVLTISLPAFFLSFSDEGSWVKFWTLFGASNQLLAALTLTAVSVWLVRSRKFAGFTLAPMLFVLTTTLWALGRLAVANARASQGLDVALINAAAATLLIALALYLLVSAARVISRERRTTWGKASPKRSE
jgi:carbon starvation protein